MKAKNVQDVSWKHVLYENSKAIEERETREEAKQVWNRAQYQVQEDINDVSE